MLGRRLRQRLASQNTRLRTIGWRQTGSQLLAMHIATAVGTLDLADTGHTLTTVS